MDNSKLQKTLGIQVKTTSMSSSMNFCYNTCGKLYKVHTVDDLHSAGYHIGRPVVAGAVQVEGDDTDVVQRSSIQLWKPGYFCLLSLSNDSQVNGKRCFQHVTFHNSQQEMVCVSLLRRKRFSMDTILQQGVYFLSACRIWVDVIRWGQWSHNHFVPKVWMYFCCNIYIFSLQRHSFFSPGFSGQSHSCSKEWKTKSSEHDGLGED